MKPNETLTKLIDFYPPPIKQNGVDLAYHELSTAPRPAILPATANTHETQRNEKQKQSDDVPPPPIPKAARDTAQIPSHPPPASSYETSCGDRRDNREMPSPDARAAILFGESAYRVAQPTGEGGSLSVPHDVDWEKCWGERADACGNG